MAHFEVDPDIRRAKTLPSEFYLDPEYFDLSKEKILARSWQFLCRESEVEGLFPATLLPGVLDEPVLLSRAGGELRQLFECLHPSGQDPC